MAIHSADKKWEAKSPAAECDEPPQSPEAAQVAPPALSHGEALRAAVEMAARERASLHQQDAPVQKDAPGAQQDAPPVQPPDAAALAARERLSRPRKDAAVQEDAPGAQQDSPPALSYDEALRAAVEMAAREQLSRPRKDAPGAQRGEIHPSPTAYSWTKARIAVAQEIWGEGFVAPGGTDMIMSMVEPLGLKRKMTVLDLGVGLGGPARIIGKRFGVHVTGVEWDSGLAKEGQALSRRRFWRAGKVPIHSLGQTAGMLSLDSFDRFIAKDCLLVLPDKDRFLRLIGAILMDHGELLFTDFVLTAPERRPPAVEAWIAAEPETPVPWSAMDYIKLLSGLGLHIRIEDKTEQIWFVIQQSLAAADARVEQTGLDPALSAALASEASLWTRRVGLLESGELNYYRFHVARRL